MDLTALLLALENTMRSYYTALRIWLEGLRDNVQSHIDDTNNPHQVDKIQVGLEYVQNMPVATEDEAEAGLSNNSYMTPYLTYRAIVTLGGGGGGGGDITFHTTDTSNPHSVTAAQVGLGSVPNFSVATQVEAEAGTVSNRFMTPQRVGQAITALIGNTVTTHISNTSNPHNVTAAQVGLGNLSNYPIATQVEAEAGVAANRYMTPERVAQAIAALASPDSVGAHLADFANPHNVTATQVGLGNLSNFSIATQAEAEAGTASNRYMTPQRVGQAITVLIGNTVTNHISNTSNPHGVTAAQVGLGSVPNYSVASQAEAEAGTASNRFMTPQRVGQAIAALALSSARTLAIANGTGITGGNTFDLSANRTWTIGLTGQALALHNLATNGFVVRTAANTIAARSIAVSGTGLSVSNQDGVAGNPVITSNATNANTVSTIVARDASGNFSAGTITANLTGNATTATTLATGRTINGTSFNGSANITTLLWGTSRVLSFSGDVTGSSSVDGASNVTFALTLADSGVTAGTYNNVATQVRPFTVDAKGRVTAIGTAITITPAWTSISGRPTTLSGYGITDAATSAALTSHTGNTSNPHGVTAAQVGLGSVPNYSVASQAEAEAGVATNRFMTPQRVAQAIAALGSSGSSLTLATQAQAEAGVDDVTYMSPLKTYQQLDALVLTPLASIFEQAALDLS